MMLSRYSSVRLRSVIVVLAVASLLSSCVRQDTVCHCVNNSPYNGKTSVSFAMSKRNLRGEAAEKECYKWQLSGNGAYDTCTVKVIK